MSKWREIRRYAKGTPTKTTKRLRRQHLFTKDGTGFLTDDPIQPWHSHCGLHIFASQMAKDLTDAQLCRNCVKAMAAGGGEVGNRTPAIQARKKEAVNCQAEQCAEANPCLVRASGASLAALCLVPLDMASLGFDRIRFEAGLIWLPLSRVMASLNALGSPAPKWDRPHLWRAVC